MNTASATVIGAVIIAVAVGGGIVYNGHQERLQRQCHAMLKTLGIKVLGARYLSKSDLKVVERIAKAYKLEGKTNGYCMVPEKRA